MSINLELKKKLQEAADEKYKEFTSRLIPGCMTIQGVRMPKMRKIAKDISKGDWRNYLDNALDDSFEEVMIQGLVIGFVRTDFDDILVYVKKFIPKINNWSVNDTFCNNIKIVQKNQSKMWEVLKQYIYSDNEFEQRIVAIMLMDYFLNDDYIDRVFETFDKLKHEGYYLKMGVAWAIATAYVKYPEKTTNYLKNNTALDDFTYNKAIQKMIESFRISDEDKIELKRMKRS